MVNNRVVSCDSLRRQDVSLKAPTLVIWETRPVEAPLASSSETRKNVPAGRARKVTARPTLVVAFQAESGMEMERGVEFKGTTVSLRGNATSDCRPVKSTV